MARSLRPDAIGGDGADRLLAERQVDVAGLGRDGLDGGIEPGAIDDRLDAGDLRGFLTGPEQRPFRPVHSGGSRGQEERGSLRFAVDEQDRARDLDAAEVEELLVLLELVEVRLLGGARDDGDAVADDRHDLRPPRGELGRGKRVGEQAFIGSHGRAEKKDDQCGRD